MPTLSTSHNSAPVSPVARSVGAATACLIVGLLVCLAVYLLRALNFAPLSALVAFEDRLYLSIAPPALALQPDAHPVIFVDIDDEALRRWGAPRSGGGTPRKLIAQLVRVLRAANASVIFLDFDFSNHQPDDQQLAAEFAVPSTTAILLPRFFGFGVMPACTAQAAATAPMELNTAFDEAIKAAYVGSVHALVTVGAYGLVEGVCTEFRIRSGETQAPRMAAMIRAVNLARARDEPVSAHMIALQWWIHNDTDLLHDEQHRLAYARIKASVLLHDQDVDTRGIDLSAVNEAVVIVGSTHQGAADSHATPIGDLPGALVHANFALALQSVTEKSVPVSVQFLLDVVLIIVSSALTIPLCWLPIYKSLPPGARISQGSRIFRLVREGVVVALFGVLFATVFLLLTRLYGGFLAAWRFGMLSFVLCAGIVLLIELISAAAEAAAEVAEAITGRVFHQELSQPDADRAPREPAKGHSS